MWESMYLQRAYKLATDKMQSQINQEKQVILHKTIIVQCKWKVCVLVYVAVLPGNQLKYQARKVIFLTVSIINTNFYWFNAIWCSSLHLAFNLSDVHFTQPLFFRMAQSCAPFLLFCGDLLKFYESGATMWCVMRVCKITCKTSA